MPTIRRTDEELILSDHEKRILALERAPSSHIYIDDRVITDPVSVVTFRNFPALPILELTWQIQVDAAPAWIYLAFQGDYPDTENDYRWRLFGDVTASESDPSSQNFAGAVGGAAILGDDGDSQFGPNWGRVRFIDHSDPDGIAAIWQGDGGLYDGVSPHTWLISGAGDPSTPLTEINVFAALADSTSPDDTKIVSPSRLTLTAY